MVDIFEVPTSTLDEIFNIESYDRSLLLLFRNANNAISTIDLSRKLPLYKIDLKFGDVLSPNNRYETWNFFQDDKSSIDILSIFTRLYDEDTNNEDVLYNRQFRKVKSQFQSLIEECIKRGYVNIFMERDFSFDYEWIDVLREEYTGIKLPKFKFIEDYNG